MMLLVIDGCKSEWRIPTSPLSSRPVWGPGGQAFELTVVPNTMGAPFLRVLGEGAGTTNASGDGSRPPDLEMKSSSIPHSPSPARPLPEVGNDNCSRAIARAIPESLENLPLSCRRIQHRKIHSPSVTSNLASAFNSLHHCPRTGTRSESARLGKIQEKSRA